VQPLLDAVVAYLPSPLDKGAVTGTDASGAEVERAPSVDAPLAALAFKIADDKHTGRITYIRVYSGTISAGDTILNATTGKRERAGRLLLMHANRREERDQLVAGEIGAAIGLKATTTGDTLADAAQPVLLERIDFAEPVIEVAITPASKGDADKLSTGLGRLADEDPTFRVSTDEETGDTLIAGMGELHLEIIVDRLRREFGVAADVGRPQVAYREAVTTIVTGVRGTHKKQTGGRGQFGDATITVEPAEPGAGLVFENRIVGGAIPKEYIPAVQQGVRDAMTAGPVAGYPLVDVKVTLTDGSYHEVDSSEMAFRMAGILALKEAARRAKPVLMEPVFAVEVTTPEQYLGDVLGDLNRRRGRVDQMDARGTTQVVTARVPLSEMFGYVGDLRSVSQGRASYAMQFDRYEPAPAHVAEEISGRRTAA
jgi:elongation factor G